MIASSLTPHLSPVRTGVSVGTTMGGISVSVPPTQGSQAPGQSLYCSVLLRLSLALSLSLTFKQGRNFSMSHLLSLDHTDLLSLDT